MYQMSLEHLVVIGSKKVLKTNQPTYQATILQRRLGEADVRAGPLEALRWRLYGSCQEDKGPKQWPMDFGGGEVLVTLTEQKGRRKTMVTPRLLHPHQGQVTPGRRASALAPFWGSAKFRVGLSLT